jgi:hypothetical protein
MSLQDTNTSFHARDRFPFAIVCVFFNDGNPEARA